MEDLNSIAVFTKVAERRSFTLAARDLRLSPSAVSKHVKDLETRLGVTLLVRSTRKLSLTEAGEAFLARCGRAMADLDDAVASVSDSYKSPRGTLRISVAWGFAETVLTPIIHEFIAQHPELRVELTMNVLPINLVEAGMDVVVRSGKLVDTSLSYCELGQIRYLICASPDYFRRHGRPAQPMDLQRHNCLTHTHYSAKEWWFVERGRDFSVRVQGNFEANSSEALRKAAANGLGVARLPGYVADDDVRSGRLEAVFPEMTRSRQVMRAFFHRAGTMPAKTAVFLDFLQRRARMDGQEPYEGAEPKGHEKTLFPN